MMVIMNSSLRSQDQELKFSHQQGFFDKSIGIRIILILLFTFFLTLFLHFREIKVEVLELNSIAPHYIVAQTDFDFIDDEATIILRQESVKDVGKIYKLSEKQIQAVRVEFDEELMHSQNWREILADSFTRDAFYQALDKFQVGLSQLRLTDRRTLQKMQEVHIHTEDYQIESPLEENEKVFLPDSIWNDVERHTLSSQDLPPEFSNAIVRFFQTQQWRVEEDIPAQSHIRKQIQAHILPKYTHVIAGNRIIDYGEKVTPRHTAMLQAMKEALSENRHLWHPLTLMGSIVMAIIMNAICAMYLYVNQPAILSSNRKFCLLLSIILITFLFAKGVEHFLLTAQTDFFKNIRYPLFVPLAAILTCNLLNPGIATFVSGYLTIVFALALSFDQNGIMILNLAAALVAILTTGSLRRRQEIFAVCAKAWISCIGVIFAIHFYQGSLWNFTILSDLISSGLFMLLTAVLVLGLLPLLETAFGIMSDVSLMEYIDPNHDLLRRLAFEAPGTYQHTLVVCNLAEAAALAIGANGLFCRVACLYHDVGKVMTPHFFTENQQTEINVHQLLTPLESAHAIMNHVNEGVIMGRKANLPEQFIDIIKEHHGTTLVYYFYRKQLERAGGDPSLVDEKEFRYLGPKPHSKESAIIMIADSFEAASRSLEKFDESTLTELINRLIREKLEDEQFDECLLTFEELGIVKKTMVKTLVSALHARVKYPRQISRNIYS